MKSKKIVTLLLLSTMISNTSYVFAEDGISRGEAAQMLIEAADDYNPTVKKSDIIKGYGNGQTNDDKTVTRAEALIMLKRAFGELPAPVGDNLRAAIPKEEFTDIPTWATDELSNVLNAGIVAGTNKGEFSPNAPVTKTQLELFIKRVYALFGTNEKDDFYAAVNKEYLDTSSLKPGRIIAGTFYDLSENSSENVATILKEIVNEKHPVGSTEEKITNLYNNIITVMNSETTDKNVTNSLKPLQPYFEAIDNAKNISDLMEVQAKLKEDLACEPFMGFSLAVDSKDSTRYILTFNVASYGMTKDFYENESAYTAQKELYLNYLTQLLTLCGTDENIAKEQVSNYYLFEKELAKNSLNIEDRINVDNYYNIYNLNQIKELFPEVDINKVLSESGLKEENKILVSDKNLLNTFANLFTEKNIETLKAQAKITLISSYGSTLTPKITKLAEEFNESFLGTSGTYTNEEKATAILQQLMPDYIGKIYAEKYFSEEAKKDVEKMTFDIIANYEKRIDNLTWMSKSTKEKAKNKLKTMNVKIGYPNKWDSYLDNVEFKSTKDGGSYFKNIIDIAKASNEELIKLQGTTVDKEKWSMYPFTANAMYNQNSNDITFPVAMLQKPFYDKDASYEENLGGIGYVIAHEITHAFDNNGAKYDENGNATDWWTKEDYEAFNKLCNKMIDFYEYEEAIPGVDMDGKLTLSENIADQGAVACLTEIANGVENFDFQKFYHSMAIIWANTKTRDYAKYSAEVDVHSSGKLRVNRVVVNCDEFYKAFNITEKDGMYVEPADRIKIW